MLKLTRIAGTNCWSGQSAVQVKLLIASHILHIQCGALLFNTVLTFLSVAKNSRSGLNKYGQWLERSKSGNFQLRTGCLVIWWLTKHLLCGYKYFGWETCYESMVLVAKKSSFSSKSSCRKGILSSINLETLECMVALNI